MQEQDVREAAGGAEPTRVVPLTDEQRRALGINPQAGVQPLALPAGFNGSCITRDPVGGRLGMYPMKTVGTFVLTSGSLAVGNNINLCYVPANSMLTGFTITNSGLTGTLQDNLPTPTVYCTTSGAVSTPAQATAGQAQNLGTMYANTPRAVGVSGAAVVQWQRGTLLQLVLTGTPTYTTPVVYVLEFSPASDAGV